jgi:hypothetical protein
LDAEFAALKAILPEGATQAFENDEVVDSSTFRMPRSQTYARKEFTVIHRIAE